MNQNLIEKTQEWMCLERKTLQQRKAAEMFYDENLMDLIAEDYVERNVGLAEEKAEYFIATVGTSYEPIVLNIKLFEPKQILFLYTRKSEQVLEKVVQYCGLKAFQYQKKMVEETEPLDIYYEIKNAYLKWERPQEILIDFTGGTKAMSAACAMAGAMIDVRLIYVGTTDYLVDFRKPNPGSETLFYISNPLAVFGDMEIEKALILFQEFNYAGAKEKLEVLKETIPDPQIRQQLKFVYLLACAYEAWDALDFSTAYEFIQKLDNQLKRDRMHRDYLLMDFAGMLRLQEQMLEILKEIPNLIKEKKNMTILKNREMIISLMFTMYQNAMTREKQGKLDMATLLLYRLLEMIEQRRLAGNNLYVSAMDYTNMIIDPELNEVYAGKTSSERVNLLKTDVKAIKGRLFGRSGNGYLPDQISLLEGFIILYAFHDPIVYQKENDHIDVLKRIRAMVYLRNNSIFAHGLGPVREVDYLKFRNFVKELFIRFCKVEHVNFEEYEGKVQWIQPMLSKNYTALEEK